MKYSTLVLPLPGHYMKFGDFETCLPSFILTASLKLYSKHRKFVIELTPHNYRLTRFILAAFLVYFLSIMVLSMN